MSDSTLGAALRRLRNQLVGQRLAAEFDDGQLLDRFIRQHEEAAFAALVYRHGPMVLSVCRRILPRLHDAEDAFQATFLVLAKKARSIRKRHSAMGAIGVGSGWS